MNYLRKAKIRDGNEVLILLMFFGGHEVHMIGALDVPCGSIPSYIKVCIFSFLHSIPL